MKSTFIIILTFLSLILYGQNNMNEQLNRLFLDLDLSLNLKDMVQKSSLKFEYGVNQTVNWGTNNNNTGDYIATFDKNPFMDAKIKKGVITIIPGKQDAQANSFSINERVWFNSKVEMVNEYNKICTSFEKLGYKVKNTIVQNDNFETRSENTEILMEFGSKKSTLTIGYYLPLKGENNKEYVLAFIYTNN